MLNNRYHVHDERVRTSQPADTFQPVKYEGGRGCRLVVEPSHTNGRKSATRGPERARGQMGGLATVAQSRRHPLAPSKAGVLLSPPSGLASFLAQVLARMGTTVAAAAAAASATCVMGTDETDELVLRKVRL